MDKSGEVPDGRVAKTDDVYSEDYTYEYLFPYPLADLYRRYRVSRNPSDRLGYLLASAEASLKFLVAVALARGAQDEDTNNYLTAIQPRMRIPSFGVWRELLEILVPATEQPPTSTIEHGLANCIRDKHGNPAEYLRSMEVLIEQRNIYVHSAAMTSEMADSILTQVLPRFRQAFRALLFLAHCPFIVCEEVRRIRRPHCFEAVIRLCRGSNPVFPYEVWRLDESIDPLVPLLVTSDLSTAYSLHPLVTVFPDEGVGHLLYYFYHHQKRKTIWQTYQSQVNNTRTGTADMEAEMVSFLDGETQISKFNLVFNQEVRPVWSLSLKHDLTAPAGYSLLGQIGEGRYGIVHRVLHTGLKEVRALKILRLEVAQDPRMRKRFEVEAQITSTLRGKGVAIDLYEYAETPEGIPYLIMQFAEQGSLEEAMRVWGPKPWQEVLDIGIKCFRSLEKIHRNGILHRDIKLSNILIMDDSFLFCDFGVGKLLESDLALTVEGDAIGTMGYMAPEQRGGVSDARSDLFSLGVCMVHLLAGDSVVDPRGWLYQQYDGTPDIRNALLSIIESIPANRPPSAAAVLERLASIKEKLLHTNPDAAEVSEESIVEGALQPILRAPSRSERIWKSPDETVFREIPAGEFFMGGTKYPDERPVHKVRISRSFLLATTLVTNAQFLEFCRATRYNGDHHKFLFHARKHFFEVQWKEPNAPVVFVTWKDAKEYALWRCEQDNRDYRLPTEGEWEYACRAGTRTVYYWGNDFDPSKLNANGIRGYPTPVGAYPPNPWGLFDMLGNVWEWCEDVMEVVPKEESMFYRYCSNLPGQVGIDPVNTNPNPMLSRRVQIGLRAGRGGSFDSKPHNCRPANRRGHIQTEPVRSFGFRLAVYDVAENELIEIDSK